MDQAAAIITEAIGLKPDRGPVRRILIEPTTDSEGEGALSVTLVIDPGGLSGAEAVTIFSDVQRAMMMAGDPRFPIIGFATEDDLIDDDGSEP